MAAGVCGPARVAVVRPSDRRCRGLASHFTRGFDELAAVKRRFGAAPWFARMEREFTGTILRTDEGALRCVGVALLDPVKPRP